MKAYNLWRVSQKSAEGVQSGFHSYLSGKRTGAIKLMSYSSKSNTVWLFLFCKIADLQAI